MRPGKLDAAAQTALEQLLGYLNFSSGAADPQFLQGLNAIYARVLAARAASAAEAGRRPRRGRAAPEAAPVIPCWKTVLELLSQRLDALAGATPAFSDATQARHVLSLMRDQIVPGYRAFHDELLFHLSDDALFGPFLLGRMFEATLRNLAIAADDAQVAERTIADLNDFIGHRPIPTLESQKIAAQPKERVRPLPLWIRGAGVAVGPFSELIGKTVELLERLDDEMRLAAYFDPDLLDELAMDPRAYDFDHPVNKRPNYHFGEWDPHCIDSQGRYRRFVLRDVTLRALMARVEEMPDPESDRDELLWEAAAVLSGTILMAAGVSGSGPDSHDSQTTLMTLVTRIAAYRDAYYERLYHLMKPAHAERLRREARRLRQPFGGARQHLNAHLASQRAAQLERVRLARVFARMGYVAAAQRLVDAVPVASARMICRIDCAVTAGRQALRTHHRQAAMVQVEQAVDLLHRGVACGAIVDPWNILGFDGNFSLFPAIENSIHDHRIDELVEQMDRLFDLMARLWSDAAAMNDMEMSLVVESRFRETAHWWHQFAAHEVSATKGNSALVEFEAARQVTAALDQWHRGGANAGDVRFWAPYVETFDSPKAYALVIETLLGRCDFVSSRSLLVHWVGQAPRVALERGHNSFHQIAHRWVQTVVRFGFPPTDGPNAKSAGREAPALAPREAWMLLQRFFAFLEPNAESYWTPPEFRLGTARSRQADGARDRAESEDQETLDDLPEEAEGELFQAAYENVVYRDSTNDGFEGDVYDEGPATNAELEEEAGRIADRLAFLDGLARMWTATSVAVGSCGTLQVDASDRAQILDAIQDWHQRAQGNRLRLQELLEQIKGESIPPPVGHHESMIDYDRHRLLKETLLEQTITTIVETSQAERFLRAAIVALQPEAPAVPLSLPAEEAERQLAIELERAAQLLAAAMRRDRQKAAEICDALSAEFPGQQILYVPLSKAGSPQELARVRMRKQVIENLLAVLPRLGLVSQTLSLIDAVREMEQNVPDGRGAVTQFDELFEVGFRELVHCLVRASAAGKRSPAPPTPVAEKRLISGLEKLTEVVLRSWLEHSRTLRLSVLERVRTPRAWQQLVAFIERYGGDLFTQRFMGLGNIRAILHCGVDAWLQQLQESDLDLGFRLLRELDESIPRAEAVDRLTLILEAIVENYHEYRDYNSTTTQSDRGDMLYTLLDFLRLQAAYDRVAWNLTPVVIAHEILVRTGRNDAAQIWRRGLGERVGGEAERYLKRLQKLQVKYAMRMASVADRLGERFLRPMTIDRMRALVKPALEQLTNGQAPHAFEILEAETALLMREPTGSGLDVPHWLAALEEEIDLLQPWALDDRAGLQNDFLMAPLAVSWTEIRRQLDLLT